MVLNGQKIVNGEPNLSTFLYSRLGHDVYIGNNRGTEYSQTHTTLDAETDQAEYWNFSFNDYADDVLANVIAMHLSAGTGKGWYYGWSMGTVQMLVALTKYESELSPYLNKAILLTPCTLLGEETEPDLTQESMEAGVPVAAYPVGSLSSKDLAHGHQNTVTQRFQEFVEDWSYPDHHEAKLYPLENISTI